MTSFVETMHNALVNLVTSLLNLPSLAEHYSTEKVHAATCRVASSVPPRASPLLQIAHAVEALEHEHYAAWPPILRDFLPTICAALILAMAGPEPLALQRYRYAELLQTPHLVAQLTHGFTCPLPLSDRPHFVQTLQKAGRREIPCGDEIDACLEEGVLHVALSYRHANTDYRKGKISRATAEEAYDIISNLLGVSQRTVVRVWIDQNLHRYPESQFGPWYERGLLPYAVLPVVSALSETNGFTVGRTRPWIWVETSLAVAAGGVNCKPQLHHTLSDLFCISTDIMAYLTGAASSRSATSEKLTTIRKKMVRGKPRDSLFFGKFATVESCLRKALVAVSFWTPAMLEHAEYPFADEFWPFVLWARMQLIRLRTGSGLGSLNGESVEDTWLERLAWIKCLPDRQSSFEKLGDPYLRIEADAKDYASVIDMLKVSGICFVKDGIYEIADGVAESALVRKPSNRYFYFRIDGDKVLFDVNPSLMMRGASQPFSLTSRSLAEKVNQISTSRGSYTLWDRRFPPGELPAYKSCCSIFNLDDELRHRLGECEKSVVQFGQVTFQPYGFAIGWDYVERVYQAQRGQTVRRLNECDILCLRALKCEDAEKFVTELMDDRVFESAARIIKAQKNMSFEVWPSAVCVGTDGENIWRACRSTRTKDDERRMTKDRISVGHDVVAKGVHHFALYREDIGLIRHTFETKASREELVGSITDLRMNGDVEDFLEKMRLMMGSPEFDGYKPNGLCLGPHVVPGGEDAKPYPKKFRLDGSEFHRCLDCSKTYSPVNRRLCILSSCRHTRRVQVKWTEVHGCHEFEHENVTLELCSTCKNLFSPRVGKKCVIFTDAKSKSGGFIWKGVHECPARSNELDIFGEVY